MTGYVTHIGREDSCCETSWKDGCIIARIILKTYFRKICCRHMKTVCRIQKLNYVVTFRSTSFA